MSKLQWMPLNLRDFDYETEHLSDAQFRANFRLVAYAWHNQTIPSHDVERIAKIAKVSVNKYQTMSQAIAELPMWKNGWLDALLKSQIAKHEAQSRGGRMTAEAKRSQNPENLPAAELNRLRSIGKEPMTVSQSLKQSGVWKV
jgi:uncharacterized protein YdaU (DUF1376 family)